MSYQNAYSAYQKNNISTASQGRLVVLLYEGAIKHLNSARNLLGENAKLKPNQIEQFGIHIYFNEELLSANINQNKEKIDSVIKMLSDLAEAWRTIANSTANAPASKIPNAVNIVG